MMPKGGFVIRFDRFEDPRRRLLIQALSLGLFALIPARAAVGQVFGSRPSKLPAGQSVYRIVGTVTVNGAPATLQTQIRPGDTIETGRDGEIVFVIGGQSMILRAGSRLEVAAAPRQEKSSSVIVSGLRLLTGGVLSVSRGSGQRLETANASIGIRGTGWYAEAEPERTYFCTCYGVADIGSRDDPTSRQTVAAKHHDRPLYVVSDAPAGERVRNAPFINHTDQELMLIETLVGRTPPFVFPRDEYKGPRPGYR
jgi:hypothetical protein